MEKELNELKKNDTKKLVDYNDIIVIHFISGDGNINHAIKCLKTEKFIDIVDRLYKIYDEYKRKNNIFLVNGSKIDIFQTIEQIKIKDGEKIQLQIFNESSINFE